MGAVYGAPPFWVGYPSKSWSTVNPCPIAGLAAARQSADKAQAIFTRPKFRAAFNFSGLDLSIGTKVFDVNIGTSRIRRSNATRLTPALSSLSEASTSDVSIGNVFDPPPSAIQLGPAQPDSIRAVSRRCKIET